MTRHDARRYQRYRLGPFAIDSMLPLDLLALPMGAGPAAIVIDLCAGTRPDTVRATAAPGFSRGPDGVWSYHMPAIASVDLLRDANGQGRIRVWPVAAAPLSALGRLLAAGPLATLSCRLGALPLKAAAVLIDDRAVILAGGAGAGKSALAAALVARGARLVADDLLFVGSVPSGDTPHATVRALPGLRPVALWPDIVPATGLTGPGRPIRQGVGKHLVDCATTGDDAPPVAMLVFLRVGREPSAALAPVAAAAAARKLIDLTRSRFTVAGSGAEVALLTTATLLANGIPTHDLRRTSIADDLPALAALVDGAARGHMPSDCDRMARS